MWRYLSVLTDQVKLTTADLIRSDTDVTSILRRPPNIGYVTNRMYGINTLCYCSIIYSNITWNTYSTSTTWKIKNHI